MGRIGRMVVVWLVILLTGVGAFASPEATFNTQIKPLLVDRCLSCHGEGGKSGLDLRSRATALSGGSEGAAIVPGDPEGSLLFQKVAAGEMPPKEPLPQAEIDLLRQWITEGAWLPDTPIDPFAVTTGKRAGYDWWSLQPLQESAPPEVENEAWSRNPIDRFVFQRLQQEGLQPSPPADARTLMRRATYDLTGLPPTLAELDAFLTACAEETGDARVAGEVAYTALLERLLASPHYGEHWGNHWMDVVRYGESTGYEVNHLIDNIWPYRDYIIQSFNEDKPFTRFVHEQLAGDAIAPGDAAKEAGMTFLVCGPYDIVGNQDPVAAAQIRANTVDEIIRTSSEAFLGLTVGCARCHDHKFDPIRQRDYYRMYATFAGVYHGDRTVATEAQAAARAEQLKPLEARRNGALKQKNELEATILARAETRAAEYEQAWTRPPVNRRGTEECFAPAPAKYVRLTVEGRDDNPNLVAGFRIDEIEVFAAPVIARNESSSDEAIQGEGDHFDTHPACDAKPRCVSQIAASLEDSLFAMTDGAEKSTRNAAAAANGGMARGSSNAPGDFANAYDAALTIDGKYGARWVAAGPELILEFAQVETIDRVVFSSDRSGALDEKSPEIPFPAEYRIEVSTDGEAWAAVATSRDRKPVSDSHRRKRLMDGEATEEERSRLAALDGELAAAEAAVNSVPPLPYLRVGNFQQPEAQQVFLGGDPQRKGDEVVPASLMALEDRPGAYALASDAPEQDRRVAFARWITHKDNPLPARVLANRIWQYHFGTGIVSTPSDFGFMGMPPSHPALLDWLARELIAPTWGVGESPVDRMQAAWRLKRLHRLIMSSQAYRQSGDWREDAARIDADSRLLWRFPPRRLSGEELRDTMLQVAGVLDMRMGGPGFHLYSYLRDNVATYIPLDAYGPETYRRSVYHQEARAMRVDLITDFDSPDCALAAPKRTSTTSPLQALTLLNHRFTVDMAEALAKRLQSEHEEPAAQVWALYRLAYARIPTPEEEARALALAEAHGLDALARAVFNTNEFVYLN
ncbi:MAG: DUF1553 domain-containing protein [Candidatus Hydrogenedentes bacterium]|nr:DUF1553 domain-containing protein [Candidatus Hydrogenedentota bacterium]